MKYKLKGMVEESWLLTRWVKSKYTRIIEVTLKRRRLQISQGSCSGNL